MRSVLRFVTSRYGLAGLAALAVVLVVVVGRLFGLVGGGASDSNTGPVTGAGQQPTTVSESPIPNDAPTAAPTKPNPVVKPGQAGPLVVAKQFADAYLKSDGAAATWRAALTRYATTKLATEIKTMDPATVPAKRLVGTAALGDHGANWAEVDLPTDAGTLVFQLVSGAKAWQVNGIDWNPTS
jgi:hypothetical protein